MEIPLLKLCSEELFDAMLSLKSVDAHKIRLSEVLTWMIKWSSSHASEKIYRNLELLKMEWKMFCGLDTSAKFTEKKDGEHGRHMSQSSTGNSYRYPNDRKPNRHLQSLDTKEVGMPPGTSHQAASRPEEKALFFERGGVEEIQKIPQKSSENSGKHFI